MKYDVFISYSRKDTKIADEVSEALTLSGLRCFIDREGIDGGANFPEVLANMIDDSGVFLLLASKNSYQSKFTQAEILHAFKQKYSRIIIHGRVNWAHSLWDNSVISHSIQKFIKSQTRKDSE